MASRTGGGGSSITVVSMLVAATYVFATIYAISSSDYDTWGGLIVAGVLAVFSAPLLASLAKKDPDPKLGLILVLAFVAKQLGTFLRYIVVVRFLGGDALEYHEAGKALAPAIRAFDFGAPAFEEWVPDSIGGTSFIRVVTGTIYAGIGTSRLAGFMIFSFLGFWGLYLTFRAFRIGVPEGRHRRFALLLFFTPTLMFWPSSIGKESWLIFVIGLTVYGAARFYTRQPFGIPCTALGLLGSAMVRPHLTVLLLAALILGRVVGRIGRRTDRGVFRRTLGKVVVLALIIGGTVMTIGRASSFFNVDELDAEGVTAILDETQRRSSQGDSAFTPTRVTSPIGLPVAVVTVLFRPFPHEAHNLQARATALESLLLLGFAVTSWRQLVRLPSMVRRYPIIAFATVFVLIFVIAFSAVGNFGILARQRTQVLPFLFMLLALPKRRRSSGGTTTADADTDTDPDLDGHDEAPEPVGPRGPRIVAPVTPMRRLRP